MTSANSLVNFYLEHDILTIEFAEGITIDLPKAKEIVTARQKFTNGQSYPCLGIARKSITLTKEARDYFSSEEGMRGIKANAFVADSVFKMFLANFFLSVSVSKKRFPSKIFTDKQKALHWLKQFTKTNRSVGSTF
jgi:hypothetical protein